MAAMPIRLFGDPVLREKCEPVAEFDGATQGLIRNLIDSVDDAEGLGLAAPQIGVSRRAIVVIEPTAGTRKYVAVVNPEIVSACGEQYEEEGCLSIPGIYEKVKRPQSVVVKGLNHEGKPVTLEAVGVMARAFCHEIDHLDGVLFVDKIGMVKRGLLKRKLGAIRKQAKELLKSLQ
jgi:peptide deformylase